MVTRRVAVFAASVLLAACGSEGGTGGIRARLLFEGSGAAPGGARRALRLAAPPPEIDRLVITALDVGGSTLAQAVLTTSTITAAPETPPPYPYTIDRLLPQGGAWRLERVPAGRDRILRARGYLPGGAMAFAGERTRIQVRPDEITDAGALLLSTVDGVRIPRLDSEPPDTPAELEIAAVPSGEALDVRFVSPPDPDLAGFVVAITSSVAPVLPPPPRIARGSKMSLGLELASNVRVAEMVAAPAPLPIRISGLSNGVTYRVLVYAFDADIAGDPENFSTAAVRDAIPADTAAPGKVTALTVTASVGLQAALLSFTGTGDDGEMGRPAAYELRAAERREQLEDPADFAARPAIEPPMPLDAGQRITFSRSFDELGVSGTDPFYVALRAVDAAGNRGPIEIAPYTLPPITPIVEAFAPEVALAGGRVEITGRLFGAATGTVTLTAEADVAPRSRALQILAWSDTRIEVAVPADARSGMLRIARATGGTLDTYLAVLRRIEGELGPALPPFALAGSGEGVAALYSARAVGNQYESAVERIIDLETDGGRYEPFVTPMPLTAAGASYYPDPLNLFLFVASSAGGGGMSAALISSSTVAANPRRIRNVVAGMNGADGVAVVLLWAARNTVIPAVLAFSRNGVVRVSYVRDLQTDTFTNLRVVTSTGAYAEYVALERRATTGAFEYLMAYREGGALRGELVLQQATGIGQGPGNFVRSNFATRPPMGERVRILDVPGAGFVLAYEERQLGGRVDVRLLRVGDYGVAPGYAPFPETTFSRRLEDAGIVLRNGQPWIALATSVRAAGSRLNYAEIPLSAVAMRDARGAARGIELDFVPDRPNEPAPAAQLGCKPLASLRCPLAWLGRTQPSLLFVRQ